MNAALFCDNCKTAIADIQSQGIVLADLYDLERIRYYPIEKGADYSFRDYLINIEEKMDSHQLRIMVMGIR